MNINLPQDIETLEELQNKTPATVVCVTDQFACERIICAGRKVADITKTPLTVITVADTHRQPDPQALQHLFNVSKDNDAEMNMFCSDEPAKRIITFIKENKVANVLTGIPQNSNSVLFRMYRTFTHIKFFTVDIDGTVSEVLERAPQNIRA